MQELALKIIKPFVAILLILALLFIARQVGYSAGQADANTTHQAADIAALKSAIASSEKLTQAADAASLRLNKTISERMAADKKTTQEITNALSTTAHLRVNCVFDNSIMQQLFNAAASADQAAASGINNSLPKRTAPNQ